MALVAALITTCLFVSLTSAIAQAGPPENGYPQGFTIDEGVPCYAQVGDLEAWKELPAGKPVSILTDPTQPWVMIGIDPDPATGSMNSCWVESARVTPGMGEPPSEPEPTEVVATPVPDPVEQEPQAEPTATPAEDTEHEKGAVESAPVSADSTPTEPPVLDTPVIKLPSTGSGPGSRQAYHEPEEENLTGKQFLVGMAVFLAIAATTVGAGLTLFCKGVGIREFWDDNAPKRARRRKKVQDAILFLPLIALGIYVWYTDRPKQKATSHR